MSFRNNYLERRDCYEGYSVVAGGRSHSNHHSFIHIVLGGGSHEKRSVVAGRGSDPRNHPASPV